MRSRLSGSSSRMRIPAGSPVALWWALGHGLLVGVAAAICLVSSDLLLAGPSLDALVHGALAIPVAVGLAATVAYAPTIGRSPWAVHATGLVAGVLLWAHGLYAVLPALGLDELSRESNGTLQLSTHAAVFGVLAAGWLEAKLPARGFAAVLRVPAEDRARPLVAAAAQRWRAATAGTA